MESTLTTHDDVRKGLTEVTYVQQNHKGDQGRPSMYVIRGLCIPRIGQTPCLIPCLNRFSDLNARIRVLIQMLSGALNVFASAEVTKQLSLSSGLAKKHYFGKPLKKVFSFLILKEKQ